MLELDLETTFREARELVVRIFVLTLRAIRRWRILAIGAVLGAIAAWQAPKLLPPIYKSESLLMYRETLQAESLLGGDQRPETWAQMSRRFIDIVMSRSSLEKLITEYDLYPKIRQRDGMIAAVQEMHRKADVRASQGAAILVSFMDTDPDKVHAVTTRLVDLLKRQPGQDAAARAEGTRSFLAAQLTVIKQDLEAREQALAGFLAVNPDFALEGIGAGGARVGATIRAAERRAPAVPGRVGRIDALTRQAGNLARRLQDPTTAAPTDAAPTPAPAAAPIEAPPPEIAPEDRDRIAVAERTVADASARLDTLRAQFTELHPDVAAARKDLDRAKAELGATRRSARLVARPLPNTPPPRPAPETPAPATNPAEERVSLEKRLRGVNDAIVVERQTQGVETAEAAAPAAVSSVVALEMRWIALNRDVDSMREQHDAVERRLFQAATLAKVEASGGRGEIVTVDAPYKPTRPEARGPRSTAAKVFVGFLFAALALAFALTLLDDHVRDEYELRKLKLGSFAHALPWITEGKADG